MPESKEVGRLNELYLELGDYVRTGQVEPETLEGFIETYRPEPSPGYEAAFNGAIGAGAYNGVPSALSFRRFLNEDFSEPCGYHVAPMQLPTREQGYSLLEAEEVVVGWIRDGAILGAATCADGLRYGAECNDDGHYGSLVCIGSKSVGGEVLVLETHAPVNSWSRGRRYLRVYSQTIRMDGGASVLVRVAT